MPSCLDPRSGTTVCSSNPILRRQHSSLANTPAVHLTLRCPTCKRIHIKLKLCSLTPITGTQCSWLPQCTAQTGSCAEQGGVWRLLGQGLTITLSKGGLRYFRYAFIPCPTHEHIPSDILLTTTRNCACTEVALS